MTGAYPPSDVCGSVWWSVCRRACLLECVSEGGRGWDWAPLRVSDKDGASTTLSAGYSCITAPSWAPSLLQDWQLQWKILSTSLSTWGDSSLPGHSRVTCLHTHTKLMYSQWTRAHLHLILTGTELYLPLFGFGLKTSPLLLYWIVIVFLLWGRSQFSVSVWELNFL